ncbi:hypothetical protein TURTL08_19220 [Turicimonas sp. TL08]
MPNGVQMYGLIYGDQVYDAFYKFLKKSLLGCLLGISRLFYPYRAGGFESRDCTQLSDLKQ